MTDETSRCERCNTPSDFAIAVLSTDGVLEDVCEDCFDKEVTKKGGKAMPPWRRTRVASPGAP